MQHTLKSSIHFNSVGLHSGQDIQLVLRPAIADTGIIFVRTDLKKGENEIPALWDHVVDTRLCTVIGNRFGAVAGTIEHLMAALRGCKIDNVIVELNGPEVPIMDGSSAPFVDAIQNTGTEEQNAPRAVIEILKPVFVKEGDKFARLSPDSESTFGGEIDFDHPIIGRQSYQTSLVNGNFAHLLADSRTFGFEKDVEVMRANGLAQGGSLENAIVIGDQSVLNPDGLRHNDEFIRHKLLDAVGDLYLAGAPIQGRYHGIRAGHDMNNKILHALFADQSAWRWTSEENLPVMHGAEKSQRRMVRA